MEAKLIKVDNGWVLMVDNIMYATDENAPYARLSVKNCQAIENGYDLDELADKYEYVNYKGKSKSYNIGFKHGFQKALEIIGDKKFSEEDVKKAILFGEDNTDITSSDNLPTEEVNKFIQSLQQTEWEVEIEMKDIFTHSPSLSPNQKSKWKKQPKLDEDGCLILKRKI